MSEATLFSKRLPLFPLTTRLEKDELTIAGCSLRQLAEEYGTPLYLFDQATLDDAVQQYRTALAQYYAGPSDITFAGKAWMCIAAAQWTQRHGLWLDCTGAGEIYIAKRAGVERQRILVHGVNKSRQDLEAALTHAGILVVDNLSELRRIIEMIHVRSLAIDSLPAFWMRVRPGMAVDTHSYRQTGQEESKFGMSLAEAVEAVAICQQHHLSLNGLHFHQGSHFHDPKPIGPALETIVELLVELNDQSGWLPQVLCPGGGWGVPYSEADLPHPSIEAYVKFVAEQTTAAYRQQGLPLPQLHFEPGRSLVARAGVALYQVGAVKQSANRRWLLIDGGMADNPRPALYKARYSALPVVQPQRPAIGPAWFGGPYCESGDVLIEDLPMPQIAEGETIAMPTVGAYQLNMGSNYNGARKPAVLWLQEGKAKLIQRREKLEELVARDLPL